jgi:AcrR family transcriptional regulator
MGIKERQERDREATRRAILDAARELFVAEGYENVSIRKIADRIEYSPAAIYGYFPGKDDIFFALAEEGFRLLGGDPFAVKDEAAPLEAVRFIFQRLYEFSRQHPQYFALMFVDRDVPRVCREYERFAFAREMRAKGIAYVQRRIDAGIFPPQTPPAVALRVLTAGIVGVAVLRLSGRLAGEDADALANDVLNVILAGLQSGITFQSTTTWSLFDLEPEAQASGPRS